MHYYSKLNAFSLCLIEILLNLSSHHALGWQGCVHTDWDQDMHLLHLGLYFFLGMDCRTGQKSPSTRQDFMTWVRIKPATKHHKTGSGGHYLAPGGHCAQGLLLGLHLSATWVLYPGLWHPNWGWLDKITNMQINLCNVYHSKVAACLYGLGCNFGCCLIHTTQLGGTLLCQFASSMYTFLKISISSSSTICDWGCFISHFRPAESRCSMTCM